MRCGDQLMALAWSRGRNSLSSQLPAFLPNHRSSSQAAQQNGRQGRKKRETRLPSSHCCLCWKISDYILGEEKNLDKKSHPWELWDPFLGSCMGTVTDASPRDPLDPFWTIREGIKKKIDFFLGNSPKQRTPPTHRYSLGLT